MKIKWFGQSAFLITAANGTRIITDPYTPSERIPYKEIKEPADIVTVSHGHGDHSNVAAVSGNPTVVKSTSEVKGIKITSIAAFHDASGGSQRGDMTIFCFDIDGIRVCHVGDLGHSLSDKQVAEIGKVDILLVPVGGNFTIDANVATEVYAKLDAKVVIPMHYRNERCPNFPVAGVDEFIKGKTRVTKLEVSEVEFKSGFLPETAQIVVLTPAR
ncbi:MAG: MBL fold metallo-hydrolase [Chloroflexi bacterium]|nr:MBL fold metallo-hydrolase [Chloroflexota bacterium]